MAVESTFGNNPANKTFFPVKNYNLYAVLIFKDRLSLINYLSFHRDTLIGFVPTMGTLHRGHLSLIETSKAQCGITVASIYINPTQFNSKADYDKYPYNPEADIALLNGADCDVLYLPDTNDIYGASLPVNEHYDLGYLETTLEGAFRPGHYQGVCQVVRRLLETVKPNKMLLGLKDYQQVMVLRQLVEIQKMAVVIVGCPTLREGNGLAMSSRNKLLTADQRNTATIIYKALTFVKDHFSFENISNLNAGATEMIDAEDGMRTEYFDVRNAATLRPLQNADEPAVALVAAWCGDVRLIDNLPLN